MRILALAAALTIAATPLTAAQKPQKPHGKDGKHAPAKSAADDGVRIEAHVHFSTGEARMIRDYYEPRYRSLPPGLQKKLARGGQLPPGWQKKLQPFAPEVERRLVRLPPDYGRGVIDGHAVIYSTRSHTVIDVAVLF